MNGINALTRVTRGLASTLFSLPCEDATSFQQSATWKRDLTRTQPCCHLISDFQLPELREINFYYLKATGLWELTAAT